jgi:Pyruvate/2-oxoacid:ferredoxin oxidoreductase gamma subunit
MIAKGAILIINRHSLVPPITTTGLVESYPADPINDIHLVRPDLKLIAVDTEHHVKDRFTGNVFLLGLLSTLLPFPVSTWKRVMENALPSRYLAANEEAFIAGRGWVAQGARQPKSRA